MSRGNVLFDVPGLSLSALDRERLLHPACAGVVLFAENFATRQQLVQLVAQIKELREPPLLVAVDQEGGRVQRFREDFVRLPAARRYGDLYDLDQDSGRKAAESGGWVMASELRSAGVDLSFAPVLDVATVRSAVIGDRAFHNEASVVADLAVSFARGMRSAGMATVGKHFPGHGSVAEDSHHELPIDFRSLAEVRQQDLVPYAAAIEAGVLDGVMTAHVQFANIDENICMFSSLWIGEVLRQQLKFEGLLFTDDLHMAGVADYTTPTQRAERALAAGCEVLVMCRDTEAADEMLDAVLAMRKEPDQFDVSYTRKLNAISGHQKILEHPSILAAQQWQQARSDIDSVLNG